jgi:hypothetical protein
MVCPPARTVSKSRPGGEDKVGEAPRIVRLGSNAAMFCRRTATARMRKNGDKPHFFFFKMGTDPVFSFSKWGLSPFFQEHEEDI